MSAPATTPISPTNYATGYMGYLIDTPYYNYNATAVITAITNAKNGISPASGDIVLFGGDSTLTIVLEYPDRVLPISFDLLGVQDNTYAYNVTNYVSNPAPISNPVVLFTNLSGKAATNINGISNAYISGIYLSNITKLSLSTAISPELTELDIQQTIGLIVLGGDGSIFFYNYNSNNTGALAWYLVTPSYTNYYNAQINLGYFFFVNQTDNYVYQDTLTSTTSSLQPINYYNSNYFIATVQSGNPGSPNINYNVDTSSNNLLSYYNSSSSSWISLNLINLPFTTITVYDPTAYKTYIITNAGQSDNILTLTELAGYFMSGNNAGPPSNYYSSGSFILYNLTTPTSTYTIWQADGNGLGTTTGSAVPYTTFNSNFIFRANNGNIYLCTVNTASTISSVTIINGGLKLNQSVIYKYSQTGFLDSSNASNLLEPGILFQSILINDNTPKIYNAVPLEAVNPTIYNGDTSIFQLIYQAADSVIKTPAQYVISYNNNNVAPGDMISIVLRYWIQGQIIYSTYVVYRPSTSSSPIITNYYMNIAGDSSSLNITFDKLNSLTNTTLYPIDLSEYTLSFVSYSPSTILVNYTQYPATLIVDTTTLVNGSQGTIVFQISSSNSITNYQVNIIKVPLTYIPFDVIVPITTQKSVDSLLFTAISDHIPSSFTSPTSYNDGNLLYSYYQLLNYSKNLNTTLISNKVGSTTTYTGFNFDSTSIPYNSSGVITFQYPSASNSTGTNLYYSNIYVMNLIINFIASSTTTATAVMDSFNNVTAGPTINIISPPTSSGGVFQIGISNGLDGNNDQFTITWLNNTGPFDSAGMGIFTAPVAGTYQFIINLTYSYENITINNNNVPYFSLIQNTTSGTSSIYTAYVTNININNGSISLTGIALSSVVSFSCVQVASANDTFYLQYNNNNATSSGFTMLPEISNSSGSTTIISKNTFTGMLLY